MKRSVLLLGTIALAAAPLALAQSNRWAPVPVAKAEVRVEFVAPPAELPALVLALPPVDPSEIAAARSANRRSVAKRVQVGIGRSAHGFRGRESAALAWRELDGAHVARWEVTSPGAEALRVELVATRLPAHVQLRFAGSADPGTVYGPFSAADFYAESGRFWSPVLPGEGGVIEVFAPRGVATGDVELVLTRVSHLFANPLEDESSFRAKTVGACSVELICKSATDAALATVGKAVARMSFVDGGSYVCTGTLVNPTDGAATPYFYSAAHCIDTQAVANTLSTYWFYDRTGCNTGTLNPGAVQLTGGATLLYADTSSDVLLLRLNNAPPAGAVRAGWDAATLGNGAAITGVHHPGGDRKAVSIGTVGGFQNGLGGSNPSGSFAISDWTDGITEGGSSGSGIFTGSAGTEYLLRGGLWGGPSACGVATNRYDYYSRLDQAYPSIRQWIDPPPAGMILQVSPASIDFGGQSMGTKSPVAAVQVVNVGASAVTFGAIGTGDPRFETSGNCAVLAPGAACAIGVVFAPAVLAGPVNSTAPVSGSLAIASNAAGSPALVALSGVAEKSLVSHYYRSIMRRAPDAPGHAFWQADALRVAGLGANVNEAWYALAMAFFGSPEYVGFARSDAEFVTDLYRAFLNRAPDAPGLAFWTQDLYNGLPRGVALAGFMFSPESTAFAQGIFGNSAVRPEIDTVMDFYRGFLSRLPDGAGFQHWLQRFRAAQCSADPSAVLAEADAISAVFANGPEYAARARTNAEFVSDLYNAFLRRGGDIQGVQFWLNHLLAVTKTRDRERQDFLASTEFAARVAAIKAAGCFQ